MPSGRRRSLPTGNGRRGRAPAEPPPADDPRDVDADPEQGARTICLRQLELRPRTRAELAATLSDRGVPDDVAEQVLSRFSDVGLIDDALFARLWVSSRHRGRGLAGRALGQELRRKGVDDQTVRDAVATLDPDEERATARALVERRLPATRGLPTPVRVRRLAGVLARKGYSPGLAFAVVREALAEEGEPADDAVVPDTDDLAWLEQ